MTLMAAIMSKPCRIPLPAIRRFRDPLMEMTLSWSGTPSDFDNAAVSSNITGLGIQLKQAGQSFTINTPLVVNETDLPVLTAVPVKKSGVVLPEADFEAWATLQVDYQ